MDHLDAREIRNQLAELADIQRKRLAVDERRLVVDERRLALQEAQWELDKTFIEQRAQEEQAPPQKTLGEVLAKFFSGGYRPPATAAASPAPEPTMTDGDHLCRCVHPKDNHLEGAGPCIVEGCVCEKYDKLKLPTQADDDVENRT